MTLRDRLRLYKIVSEIYKRSKPNDEKNRYIVNTVFSIIIVLWDGSTLGALLAFANGRCWTTPSIYCAMTVGPR